VKFVDLSQQWAIASLLRRRVTKLLLFFQSSSNSIKKTSNDYLNSGRVTTLPQSLINCYVAVTLKRIEAVHDRVERKKEAFSLEVLRMTWARARFELYLSSVPSMPLLIRI